MKAAGRAAGGPRVLAIVPARLASTRFPNKPLVKVLGVSMLQHVVERVGASGSVHEVVVATCDVEIADTVRGFGGQVLMTSPAHQAATDRVAEAMARISCTHVVNVQGDEILVLPEDLTRMVEAIVREPEGAAWNALARIDTAEELNDRSIVKCVVSRSNRILFCSRDFSKLPFAASGFEPARKILGILAYERACLESYGGLARTPLETAESIDQSRMVEYDIAVRGVDFSHGYPGINEPREVALVEGFMQQDARQREILARILGRG